MKNKTSIALQGDPDTGKSLAIGLLFDLMIQNGFQIVQDKKRKSSKDFFVIVIKNGIKIGICSYGDVADLIKERCGRFVDAKCKIIIYACHPKGTTVDAIHSFKMYSPVFVPKTVVSKSKQKNANIADAHELLKIVTNLIS